MDYREIRKMAQIAGCSVRELCKRAGVNYSTVQMWKTQPPSAFEVYTRLKTKAQLSQVKQGGVLAWRMIHVPTGRIEAHGQGTVVEINSDEGIFWIAGLKYPISLKDQCSWVGTFRVELYTGDFTP